eukprot:6179544-Pleurochrysis_carterae.AAC.2
MIHFTAHRHLLGVLSFMCDPNHIYLHIFALMCIVARACVRLNEIRHLYQHTLCTECSFTVESTAQKVQSATSALIGKRQGIAVKPRTPR